MTMASHSTHHPTSEFTLVTNNTEKGLTDLPNEVILCILSFLDSRSALFLRLVCRRFHVLISDPLCWSSVSWNADNRVDNGKGLMLALKLSKSVLKELSLISVNSINLPLSKYVEKIVMCRSIQCLSLCMPYNFTENQVTKLLKLPVLEYLHLDGALFIAEVVFKYGHHLKTFSTACDNTFSINSIIGQWVNVGYIPSDLRIITQVKLTHLDVYRNASRYSRSSDCNAYLTFYHQTMMKFPFAQFHFTPQGVMTFAHSDIIGSDSPLALIKEKIDSNEFSGAASMKTSSVLTPIEHLDFCSVAQNLTTLDMCDMNILTANHLEAFASMCPNLLHLNLECCRKALHSLSGLDAITTGCPKLRILNLFGLGRSDVENVKGLWELLGAMSSLKELMIGSELIARQANLVPMPLEAICINSYWTSKFTDSDFDHLTNMPYLKFFQFTNIPLATRIFHGFSKLLRSSCGLTHLHIAKEGNVNAISLPADPSYYPHLQYMFLECQTFILTDDLASVLSQCPKLCKLVLNIYEISVRGIKTLVTSSRSLSVLDIRTVQKCNFGRSGAKATAFIKVLKQKAKDQGKIIDIKISRSC